MALNDKQVPKERFKVLCVCCFSKMIFLFIFFAVALKAHTLHKTHIRTISEMGMHIQ